jgi:Secretion system C-terminal sorting domain
MQTSKILLLALLLFGSNCLRSQTLMTLRCYFDDDANTAQYINLNGQLHVDAPFTIDVSGLAQGVHTLYIETLNFDGKWSHYATRNVQIHGSMQMATLNLVEYYFDNEPADGSAITVALNGTSIDQSFDISVDGLSNGPHVLFTRVRDAGGAWSLPVPQVIQVYGATYEPIEAAEYFWDADPGFNQGIEIPMEAFVVEGNFELSIDNLSNGVHLLYVRIQDAKGQWSLTKEQVVQIGSTGLDSALVVLGEYFIDSDPGEGLGTPIEMGPAFLIDNQFDLTMPDVLAPGAHWLYVRVLNDLGYWSQAVGRQINVCSINIPNVVVTGATCTGGNAILTAPVGYNSYLWSTGQTGNSISVTNANTYYLTVTDSDCSTTVPVEVVFEDSEPLELAVTGSTCPGGQQTISIVGNYNSYAWSGGSTNPTLSVSSSGTYSVEVNSGTCPVSGSIDVTFTTVPSLELSVSGATCAGSTQTLTVDNPVFSNYQWIGGPASANYAVTTPGNYTINAQYNGCSTSATYNVVFDELEAPLITITGNPCQDQSLQLSVPNDYSGFTWSTGAQISSTLVTENGTYTVNVLDGDCEASASIDVTFGTLVVEPISVTGTGCPGDLFTLAGANGYDSYSWSPGGNTTSFVNTTNAGIYTLTVTEGDCEGSVSTEVAYLDIPLLNVVTTGDLCPDGLITLDAGPNYDSYLWTPGNATTSFLNVTSSGAYQVEVSANGCAQSMTTMVNFIALPQPVISQTGNILTCSEPGFGYQWYLNGIALDGAINQFLNANQTGNYTVEIISGDCQVISNNYFFEYIGIAAVQTSPILIYPNPASDILYVQGDWSTYHNCRIYDVTGRMVAQMRPNAALALDGLSNGVYTIHFIGTEQNTIARFEKVR